MATVQRDLYRDGKGMSNVCLANSGNILLHERRGERASPQMMSGDSEGGEMK